ncbi:unnamed protein product [Adineta steineri]|uniref:Potassium channel tetramerisation-type BTB domain-containing protein n=1 Tax=Adineta steineri TaxID=433720 RepID=A0A819MBV6_9BILA|nr:unnamed protein product [Adineta steineri]
MHNSKNDERRSFNVLGKLFHVRIDDLVQYPNTLLADSQRLQAYWRPNLNAYFLSRDVHMFERIILPFYTSSKLSNKIKRLSTMSFSDKLFREELEFYNLLEYYQTDDNLNFIFEYYTQTSSIISLLSRLLIRKCICWCIIDCVSCIACAIGICEIVLWRCQYQRSINLLIVDIIISLILLWTLFYEQYSDRILLEINFYMRNKFDEEVKNQIRRKVSMTERFIIIGSFQSPVFIIQLIFASSSFIITLLSYKRKNTWYFILGLAFRHLLLIRLCLTEMCHIIDILCYSGRSSFRVFSHLLLFLVTILFICIWIGLTLYVTDSNSTIDQPVVLAPSRYVYFVYHIILNVGYGDTTERSILSFILIVIMTLITCPLLIIIYQNFIQELNLVITKMIHVETFHHTSFIKYLITQINRYQHRMIH